MLLTLNKIREIQLKEKSEKLQKLPENFFRDAKIYLDIKKGTIEEKSARNLIESIFNLRLKKIINYAFVFYKTNKELENLEDCEKILYLDLINLLKNYYNNFKKQFSEEEKINEKVKVIFLKDTPKFYDLSKNILKYQKGEEIFLDKKIAEILEREGYCRKIS